MNCDLSQELGVLGRDAEHKQFTEVDLELVGGYL